MFARAAVGFLAYIYIVGKSLGALVGLCRYFLHLEALAYESAMKDGFTFSRPEGYHAARFQRLPDAGKTAFLGDPGVLGLHA